VDSVTAWMPWPPSLPQTISFPGLGDYTVTLSDSSYCGVVQQSITVHVVAPPVASISASTDTICSGGQVTFFQGSSGPNQSYQWNFGNNNNWQNLGSGNYYSDTFGPLNSTYAQSWNTSNSGSAANIQVYVDNVYQIPFTNYNLIEDPSSVISVTTGTTSATSTVLYLDSVVNVSPGQTISGSAGISATTTVLGTITGTSNVIISEPVTAPVTAGTSLTFTFNTGTFIQFSGAVPAKPVVVLLGFDGYFPPG
jgi:hypothetical protein